MREVDIRVTNWMWIWWPLHSMLYQKKYVRGGYTAGWGRLRAVPDLWDACRYMEPSLRSIRHTEHVALRAACIHIYFCKCLPIYQRKIVFKIDYNLWDFLIKIIINNKKRCQLNFDILIAFFQPFDMIHLKIEYWIRKIDWGFKKIKQCFIHNYDKRIST